MLLIRLRVDIKRLWLLLFILIKHLSVMIVSPGWMTLILREVKGFLKQMDEADEFDDFELDIVALAAIAGGKRSNGNGC